MKQRIRKTGEIVDVVNYSMVSLGRDKDDFVSYIDSNGVEHVAESGLNINWDFEDVEEEFTKQIDWEERRYKIARSAMQGILHGFTMTQEDIENACHDLAKAAITIADALIAELKKGDKDV